MFEYLTLLNLYRGPRIYANADPSIGNDNFPGTADKPVLTLTEAIDRAPRNGGAVIIATSSPSHNPPEGEYAFTENVLFNKPITALIGRFTISVSSGIGLHIYEANKFSIPACLVIGCTISEIGLSEAFRVTNGSYCILASCLSLNVYNENQIGFHLFSEGGIFSPIHGGNGFIDCRAYGGNQSGSIGFKVQDEGSDSNFVLDCSMVKNEKGIYIANSALQGAHAIAGNRFDGNEVPCDQVDGLHSWFLYGNYYSDLPPGFDASGKETVWPNDSASWTFAHADERPISNIGAMFSNKMMSATSSSMIRNFLFKNIQTGFGKAL